MERSPESGKRAIVYKIRKGLYDLPAVTPCGQCTECRLKASRETAIRCMHEASLHGQQNCVVTLTYAPEHLPDNGTIHPEHTVEFMRKLRSREDYRAHLAGEPARRFKTYGCGEYGEEGGRPHYHICLFGYRFDDQKPMRGKEGYYTSDILTATWGKGGTQIMDLTFESAAYVARYITKKLNISRATPEKKAELIKLKYQGRLAEQTVCVTRKGLGKEWYKEWKQEIYEGDKVFRNTKDGRRIPMQPPKYYDRQYEIDNQEQYERIKNERKIKRNKRLKKLENEIQDGNYTNAMNQGIGSRDMADLACKEASWKLLKRGYESNET